MEIVNESELHAFAKKHSNARKPLANWLEVVKSASWNTLVDVHATFRSADYVKDQIVFDVGGNNYRVITSIEYSVQRIYVLEVMTHAEYDRWKA